MSEATEAGAPPGARVVTGQLHRVQRGHGKDFVAEPPRAPVRRPARVALMLALAHKIQQAIDRGNVRDRAEVARRLGFTRARITHLLDLTLLSAGLQLRVLELEAVDGVEPIAETELRRVVHAGTWCEQRLAFDRSPVGSLKPVAAR